MAHEITSHDNVVLHREKAWHGLGTVVENAPTPAEALKIASLDWSVEQWPISATNGEGIRLAIPNQAMNVRTDIRHPLGVVTTGYKPIQNAELADFCQLLAEQGDTVKVESAGSIRSGAKVWFLLKGESFTVRKADDITPYILVSNGHDGGTALRCTPTTVRVVCSNTLHMVIPHRETKKTIKAKPACFVANHLGDVADKIEQAKQVLGLYGRAMEQTRGLIESAAVRSMKRDDVQRFFLECYTRDFGPIATNPTNKSEERAKAKSQEAAVKVMQRFDAEKRLAGATAWNAFNAYTGWLQNDRTFWKNETKEHERKISGKLFGEDSERSIQSLLLALSV